jgi:hypothetical protein
MKMKVLVTTVAAASLCVSAAVAAPTPGKGKPLATGDGCKPKVTVVLKGTLAATPGPSALMVTVTRGNRFARAYVAASQPTSVQVDEDTKVRRQGKKTLGDLLSGDRVLVQARACKADLAEGAMPPLRATRVVAHPAAT